MNQIIKNINSRKINVGIIGLGYVGLPLAIRFSEEEFQVVGFDIDTNKKIFMLAKDTFTLVNNINKNETFLIWLNEIQETKLSNTSENYEKYRYETSIDLKNNIYSTFDYYLSDKYKVQINHQTLERLQNYFR